MSMDHNKMKAALFYGKPEDMRVEDVDIPQPGEGDTVEKSADARDGTGRG